MALTGWAPGRAHFSFPPKSTIVWLLLGEEWSGQAKYKCKLMVMVCLCLPQVTCILQDDLTIFKPKVMLLTHQAGLQGLFVCLRETYSPFLTLPVTGRVDPVLVKSTHHTISFHLSSFTSLKVLTPLYSLLEVTPPIGFLKFKEKSIYFRLLFPSFSCYTVGLSWIILLLLQIFFCSLVLSLLVLSNCVRLHNRAYDYIITCILA